MDNRVECASCVQGGKSLTIINININSSNGTTLVLEHMNKMKNPDQKLKIISKNVIHFAVKYFTKWWGKNQPWQKVPCPHCILSI